MGATANVHERGGPRAEELAAGLVAAALRELLRALHEALAVRAARSRARDVAAARDGGF